MKTLMIPCEGEGIYEVTEVDYNVSIRYWHKDPTWTHQGSLILSFDVGNSEFLFQNSKISIWDYNLLIKYLERNDKDDLGADTYQFAEIKS